MTALLIDNRTKRSAAVVDVPADRVVIGRGGYDVVVAVLVQVRNRHRAGTICSCRNDQWVGEDTRTAWRRLNRGNVVLDFAIGREAGR